MRSKGKITSWNDDKGFGFITPVAGGKQVFLHISAFGSRNRRPGIGQEVTYAMSVDKQGRPCAANVTLAGDTLTRKNRRNSISPSIIGTAVFMIIVCLAAVSARIPLLIFGLYVIASGLAFIMYAADKSAAMKGASRTPESTLHLLSLAGGWPGALIAQQQLRHKTKKQTFRAVFRMTVLMNTGTFVWLLTPSGAATLQSFISGLPSH